MVLVPVSIGELIDKITILEIKLGEIKDPEALKNIQHELELLRGIPESRDVNRRQLYSVNWELWKVEDQLRELEKVQNFGPEFIELARSVYRLNDFRARIKRAMNKNFSSDIVEEKSYK